MGCGWEMAEGEDSIGPAGIGRVLAGIEAARVMVMATQMRNIGVECSPVEGYIVLVSIPLQLFADLAFASEEVAEYRKAARDAETDK